MKMSIDEVVAGVRAGAPIAVGYLPIAVAFGALALKAELSVREALLMSALVFAGASQFMAAGMMLAGMGGVQIIAATLFINLRHMIMSLAVHNRVQTESKLWRAVVSFGITDETFAMLTMQQSGAPGVITPEYASGMMGIAYVGWISGTVLGGVGAQVIPPEVSAAMTIGLYAMFIGLLLPQMRRSLRIGLIAGTSMLLNTLLRLVLAAGWAIVLATVLSAFLGLSMRDEQP